MSVIVDGAEQDCWRALVDGVVRKKKWQGRYGAMNPVPLALDVKAYNDRTLFSSGRFVSSEARCLPAAGA
jgi:hypothetical protein